MKRIANIDELVQAVVEGLEVSYDESVKIVAKKVSDSLARCPTNVMRLNNSFTLKALYVGIMNHYKANL